MKIECEKCYTVYKLNENNLPDKPKVKVRCKHCQHVMSIDISSLDKIKKVQSNHAFSIPKNLLYGENLKKVVTGNFKKLYPMPHIMLKARQLLSDPMSDFKQIGKLVKTDQALASRILKVANSAYYGMSGKVSSLQQASFLLGGRVLVRIINMLAQSKMQGAALRGYGMNSGDLWRHSLAVAVGSDIIAREITPEYSGEAFLTGLLHDAGKVLLEPYIMERKESFDELCRDNHNALVDIEQKVLGLDHSIVGCELCVSWNLPDFVGQAILFHHYPSSSKANLLAYVIHAADTIAHRTDLSTFKISQDSEAASTLKFLHLDENGLQNLARRIFENVESMEEDTY